MNENHALLRLATLVMAADIVFVLIAGFVTSSAHAQHVVDIVAAAVFAVALIPGFIYVGHTVGRQGDRARVLYIVIPIVLAIGAALALWLVNGWSGGGPFFGAVFVFAVYQAVANQRRRRRNKVAG
jgi:hypothetical protein